MVAILKQAPELITDRANLGCNDFLDWSNLASPKNPAQPFNILSHAFSVSSALGSKLTIKIPPYLRSGVTPPFIFETQPKPGIPTNFAVGDHILFTGFIPGAPPTIGNPGPLQIKFAQPVSAFGTQIGTDDTYEFLAFLWAYDELGQLLGKFALPCQSSEELDNSAEFIGIRSQVANIAFISLSTSEPERAFGINALSFGEV